jgi:hypothetical protein
MCGVIRVPGYTTRDTQNSDVGESPERKNTPFRTWCKFEIKDTVQRFIFKQTPILDVLKLHILLSGFTLGPWVA